MVPVSASRKVPVSRPATLLQGAFWLTILLVFPLAIAPSRKDGTLVPEQWLFVPKATVLGISLAIGVLAVVSTYPKARLRDIPTCFRRLPFWLKALGALAGATLALEATNSRN